MDIKQLRDDYEELTGSRPFNGWDVEKLQEKMKDFKQENNIKEDVEVHGLPPQKEVKIKEQQTTIHEMNQKASRLNMYKQLIRMEPVFINGEPKAIVNNEYVDWAEAEIGAFKKIIEEVEQIIKEKTAELNS